MERINNPGKIFLSTYGGLIKSRASSTEQQYGYRIQRRKEIFR